MKFIRRPDLDPHTRIEIVKNVWIHQGIYGKMTQLAQEYDISRTFLYQLSWAARDHLEDLFSDPQHLVEPPNFRDLSFERESSEQFVELNRCHRDIETQLARSRASLSMIPIWSQMASI